ILSQAIEVDRMDFLERTAMPPAPRGANVVAVGIAHNLAERDTEVSLRAEVQVRLPLALTGVAVGGEGVQTVHDLRVPDLLAVDERVDVHRPALRLEQCIEHHQVERAGVKNNLFAPVRVQKIKDEAGRDKETTFAVGGGAEDVLGNLVSYDLGRRDIERERPVENLAILPRPKAKIKIVIADRVGGESDRRSPDQFIKVGGRNRCG